MQREPIVPFVRQHLKTYIVDRSMPTAAEI